MGTRIPVSSSRQLSPFLYKTLSCKKKDRQATHPFYFLYENYKGRPWKHVFVMHDSFQLLRIILKKCLVLESGAKFNLLNQFILQSISISFNGDKKAQFERAPFIKWFDGDGRDKWKIKKLIFQGNIYLNPLLEEKFVSNIVKGPSIIVDIFLYDNSYRKRGGGLKNFYRN